MPLPRYVSAVHREIRTDDPKLGTVIAVADRTPVIWAVIHESRSAAWGAKGAHQQSGATRIERAQALVDALEDGGILGWSARFTVEHYNDKHFRGGEFELFEGATPHATMMLDYTDKTLGEVLDVFEAWAACPRASFIRVRGRVVRRFLSLRGVA